MTNSLHRTAETNRSMAPQFSLKAIAIITADVAIFLTCYSLFAKDGLLLAAIAAPVLSIPMLTTGPATKRLQKTIAGILISVGMVWALVFPKSWDVLRPDTFNSILFAIGLIGAGLLIAYGKRTTIVAIILLWSLLLNLSLLNQVSALKTQIEKL